MKQRKIGAPRTTFTALDEAPAYNPPMIVEAVDHLVVAVPGLSALEPLERLGFRLTDVARHPGLGTEARVFFVGEGDQQTYIEFIAVHDRAEAEASGARASLLGALEGGGGAYRIALRTRDIAAARTRLGARAGEPYAVTRADGSLVGEVLPVLPAAGLGCDVSLIQYSPGVEERRRQRVESGLTRHALPLRRLDHLAIVAPEREAAMKAWEDALGVSVSGEVRGPGMIITQLRIGDVVVELLSPDGPESPIASRRPGLASMAAFEVQGLDGVVEDARARGFSPPDARPGPLPGTRVSTILAAECAGLNLQLLEYVST